MDTMFSIMPSIDTFDYNARSALLAVFWII